MNCLRDIPIILPLSIVKNITKTSVTLKTSNIMDPFNLFCDHCFNSAVINPSLKFYLFEENLCSSHIFCQSCVNEKCKITSVPFRKIEINDKMETRLFKKLIPLGNLGKLLHKSFQIQHRSQMMFKKYCCQTVFKDYRKFCEQKILRFQKSGNLKQKELVNVEATTTKKKTVERTMTSTEASFRNAMDKNGKLVACAF